MPVFLRQKGQALPPGRPKLAAVWVQRAAPRRAGTRARASAGSLDLPASSSASARPVQQPEVGPASASGSIGRPAEAAAWATARARTGRAACLGTRSPRTFRRPCRGAAPCTPPSNRKSPQEGGGTVE